MRPSPLLLVFPLVLPFLAGCSSSTWDYLTSFGGSGDDETPAAAETVAAATPAPALAAAAGPAQPNAFCMAVARQDAMENGFDTATQQRVAVRSYQQCVGTFGNVTGK